MKLSARNNEIRMLEGPLLGKVFLFALPLMVTNLLQMLYSAADMVIAGMSGVEGAIGSIGTCGAMINFILNIFSGFAIGTNVVVARNIGRGDKEATERSVHTSLVMAALFGAICAGVGLLVNRPILKLLGDEGHVLELATLYTRIYFCGAPFLAVSNYMIAILRAKGDTRTPLFILTGTGLLNVCMNLLFVVVLHRSVDGVAYATLIANAANVVLLGIVLMRDPGWCRVSLKKLRIDLAAMKEIIRDGLPAGVQGMLFSLSNMLIQSTIIGLNNAACPGGSSIIDGNAAATNLEGFAYVATNSVYQASVTFTSQHHGARKYRRIGHAVLLLRDRDGGDRGGRDPAAVPASAARPVHSERRPACAGDRLYALLYHAGAVHAAGVYGGRLGRAARARQVDAVHRDLADRLVRAAARMDLSDLPAEPDAVDGVSELSDHLGADRADALHGVDDRAKELYAPLAGTYALAGNGRLNPAIPAGPFAKTVFFMPQRPADLPLPLPAVGLSPPQNRTKKDRPAGRSFFIPL